MFRGILVIIWVSEVFIDNFFLGFGVILVSGVFCSSYMFRGILVIIWVSEVFIDHFFLGFGVVLVIFFKKVFGVFQSLF